MEGTGARLKKIRLAKGITLEEVHKKTKVHLDILKAIEEDSFINISPIYIKGFLKIYCQFLGLDPREYIAGYKEIQPAAKTSALSRKEEAATSLPQEPATKSIFPRSETIKKIIKIIFIFILVITVINIVFNLGKMIVHKIGTMRARLAAVSTAKVEKRALALKPEKAAASTSKAKAHIKEALPKTSGATVNIMLAIRAKEDCWIQLKADGRVIFQNILKKGRTETWEAKEKIELSLGNAGGVDLEINGKLIPSLGRRGQVLKNILITKEGLSVRK